MSPQTLIDYIMIRGLEWESCVKLIRFSFMCVLASHVFVIIS